MFARSNAPEPDPVTMIGGDTLYPYPGFITSTVSIFPLAMFARKIAGIIFDVETNLNSLYVST
jgi:hypothetical protein